MWLTEVISAWLRLRINRAGCHWPIQSSNWSVLLTENEPSMTALGSRISSDMPTSTEWRRETVPTVGKHRNQFPGLQMMNHDRVYIHDLFLVSLCETIGAGLRMRTIDFIVTTIRSVWSCDKSRHEWRCRGWCCGAGPDEVITRAGCLKRPEVGLGHVT
ncbi:hypothetical protein P170DRAFT_287515 [Aspergillus steynii IBT 23096]|uniref:Uncharacterized protein n=1 Tax=Aspergillus steynii IBT 23096 TaxID=1392250 RepID=A0A2I2FV23_9EURO|nr:uncharacterized protein P170DRAFT_287515 [Aspergillus steynii IBT 23096]PLB44495.1 hypothetical protein P170DRAFT_287515 [Aspergillus steynii IBT 23096]